MGEFPPSDMLKSLLISPVPFSFFHDFLRFVFSLGLTQMIPIGQIRLVSFQFGTMFFSFLADKISPFFWCVLLSLTASSQVTFYSSNSHQRFLNGRMNNRYMYMWWVLGAKISKHNYALVCIQAPILQGQFGPVFFNTKD